MTDLVTDPMTDKALHDAVQSALRRRWPDSRLGSLETMHGGRSGVTLMAQVSDAPLGEVVVKAAPSGRAPVGRHDVLRQARVLMAVARVPGVVVPHVLATGTEPVAFTVMTRALGDVVEPVLDAAEIHLPAELARSRAQAAARMLAALHRGAQPPARPDATEEPVADLAAEVRRWRATADAADPAILRGGVRLVQLLEKNRPPDDVPPVLVHGDYRLGNVVFAGERPTGLIDWEIWGRTHPGVDLGWFLVFCDAELFPGIGTPVAGLPSSDELLDLYWSSGGCRFADVEWFEAFGRFKMAAIMAHNLRRHREGRHVDPFQEKLPPTIERLVATGLEKLGG
ncbi:MAG TPA: phosphotransferase family protein [Jatrophihabitans sp.]|jgi:streptomycin 6-kinase